MQTFSPDLREQGDARRRSPGGEKGGGGRNAVNSEEAAPTLGQGDVGVGHETSSELYSAGTTADGEQRNGDMGERGLLLRMALSAAGGEKIAGIKKIHG